MKTKTNGCVAVMSACVLLWCVSVTGAGAQTTWARTYGGTGTDLVFSVAPLLGGGYAVAGETSSFGVSAAFWVVRLDANGNVVWEKTYSTADVRAYSIVEAANGDLLVAGGENNGAGDDLWVLRLNPAGGIVCSMTYGGVLADRAFSIQETSGGGMVLAGLTGSYGAGDEDAWVLQLDASCGVQWQMAYGGIGRDLAGSIQEITGPQPGYVVAGTTESFGAGGSDIWVLRLDPSGNVVWEKTYGGTGTDRLGWVEHPGMVRRVPGGFVLVGGTDSFGAGDNDIWLLELDDTGAILMERRYDSGGLDGGASVLATSSGFVISGSHDGGGFLGLGVDPSGLILWEKIYAPDPILFLAGASEVQPTLDGGLIFAGHTQSYGAIVRNALVVKVDAGGEGHFTCPFTNASLTGTATSAAVGATTASVQATSDPGGPLGPVVADTTLTVGTVCVSPLCPVPDLDRDGILNENDNCPTICNPSQADTGSPGIANNGIGDACDGGGDGELFYGVAVTWGPDGFLDSVPAGDDVHVPGCPVIWAGANGVVETVAVGDDVQELPPGGSQDCAAAPGLQADTILDGVDNCPGICNLNQDDADSDGIGDACCPGIAPGVDYCIGGNSTGHHYSWGFDDNGSGAIEVGEPEDQNAATPPAGSPASDLANAFATSINLEGTYSASPSANCFTSTAPSALWVGAAGQPASCKITPAGCSYNPVIFCLTPAGSPALTVTGSGIDIDLSWSSLPTGSTYDVVLGRLSALRLSGGDFATATASCVADGLAGNTVTFSGDPAAGDAYWFLVRGSGCGGGTYDTGSPSQAVSRDAGIAASGGACP